MTRFCEDSNKTLCCLLILLAGVSTGHAEEDTGIVPEEIQLGRPVEFKRDIYPILAGSCLACHNRTKAESDLILETSAAAIKGGSAGEAIVPGEPDESYLYMVAARTEEPVMPPMPNSVQARSLTPRQLGLLRQWILEGAKGDESGGSNEIAWQTLNDELTAVYSIDADPFGRFVAAGRANKVTIYDLKVPTSLQTLTDPALESTGVSHRDYAHSIAFSPNGELIATGGYRVVKLWNRANPVLDVAEELPIVDVNVSADGAKLVKISESGAAQLFQAGEDKLIADLKRDLLRERLIARHEADRGMREARVNVVKTQVTENQKQLDEQNKALEAANEKNKKATEAVPAAETKLAEANAGLTDPEKQLIAAQAALAEQEKMLSEVPDNEELKKKVAELKKGVEEQTKKIEELKKTVTAAEKAVADAKAAVVSAERGIELAQQSVARATERLQSRKDLQTLSESELTQSTATRDEVTAAAAVEMKVLAAVFVPNSSLVATIENIGTIRLWSTVDGSPVDVLLTGRAIEGSLKSAACNGRLLSFVNEADVKTTVNLLPDWQLTHQLGPRDGAASVFADRVLSLAFSPDGSRLATGGGEASRSGELIIWKTADWTIERTIEDAHSDTVYGLDFSADGRFLASGSADKFLKVFNMETGEHVRSYEGHTHHVMDVSWKADRTSLVSAGADNVLKVWNAETGEQRRTISTHKKQVTSVEYVGLEDNFLSSSGDKRIILLKAGDGKAVREFPGSSDYVYCSSITGDGKVVVAGGEDGVVRVWNTADAKSLQTFSP
jgi:WD40 repeat protein